MNPKDLTEFGRREAMSHNNNTNDTQPPRVREIQPYKYSDDVAMVICTYLRKGCTIKAACQAANIGRATYYRVWGLEGCRLDPRKTLSSTMGSQERT